MANEEHLARLREGVDAWNVWREERSDISPDLSGADLRGANLVQALLSKADLRDANLKGADLTRADLGWADLRGANLRKATLYDADLREAKLYAAYLSKTDLRYGRLDLVDLGWTDLYKANLAQADLGGVDLAAANLTKAILEGAILEGAKLTRANFTGANLRGVNLNSTILIETNLTDADLTGSRVYGISAWDVKLEGTIQRDLVITRPDQPQVTVDNLEVAQFIYLLLNNEKIRDVIDTITSKVVLILGRFTLDRKAVLDSLREELRKRDYLPVLFDSSPSESRDITETVSLLARMARFVVADITEARSIPQELSVIVPDLPSVPVQPLLQEGAGEYGMFEHFRRYPWVLEVYCYPSTEQLIATLGERVIAPAEAKVRELRG